ncbi:MAG: DUF4331 domain-containing protein [Burkholderiaceae bacterium]
MRPQRYAQFALTVVAGAVLTLTAAPSFASSHREAPFLTGNPKVDGTDLYFFRSYAPGRQDYATVIADYMPFQDPQGGPNFYQFDPNALYEIHFDNVGDGKEHLTFQFRFKSTSKKTALTVGGKQVLIPLINSGPISGVNPASLNVRETYSVTMVTGDRRGGTLTRLTAPDGGTDFDKPVDNIGDKTFGGASGYETYANQHIYDVAIPGGCGTGKLFVGQRKEPFFIAVGKIFDLINLNPLGPEVNGNANNLEGKNISTIAMELPIACLTTAGEPVIGAFTTASVRQGRLINPKPGTSISNASKEGGAWAQVSRLGMPLVNEVIIGLDDKDRFNASKPRDDGQFADYVTNPVLPAYIQSLYPSAPAPTNFPRTDLVNVFLKGISGLNQPKTVTPSEMLRLNTAIAPTPLAAQSTLGVAGGDNAGFPNGRRPADDVVDLSLRVAMGALCVLTGDTDQFKVGCKPSDAPAGKAPLTDGVRKSPSDFKPSFPYLNTPLPGNL